MTVSIARCRELLGSDAEGKTDEQLQRLAEELGSAASAFYDEVQSAWKRDPDSVRWLVYASQTGEIEDAVRDHDFVEEGSEEARWLEYLEETGDME